MRNIVAIVTGEEYDVFGDGSITIFGTPGHTPGHQSALVRLKERGPAMLSGDVAHSWDNFRCWRMPRMNAFEEGTRESMALVERVVERERMHNAHIQCNNLIIYED